jgi:hypothetical protein
VQRGAFEMKSLATERCGHSRQRCPGARSCTRRRPGGSAPCLVLLLAACECPAEASARVFDEEGKSTLDLAIMIIATNVFFGTHLANVAPLLFSKGFELDGMASSPSCSSGCFYIQSCFSKFGQRHQRGTIRERASYAGFV